MRLRSRRSDLVLVLPVVAVVTALLACGPAGASPDATVGLTSATTSARPTPILSVAPIEPGVTGAPPASQTETEWGTIWDGVPEGFPRYPGARGADDATADPVSEAYAVAGGDPADIASMLQATMEGATYSTEGLSGPFEDGSFVLESVGDADCRIETRVVPQGSLVLVTVRYGAACPAA